jgi:hypothetical protein
MESVTQIVFGHDNYGVQNVSFPKLCHVLNVCNIDVRSIMQQLACNVFSKDAVFVFRCPS